MGAGVPLAGLYPQDDLVVDAPGLTVVVWAGDGGLEEEDTFLSARWRQARALPWPFSPNCLPAPNGTQSASNVFFGAAVDDVDDLLLRSCFFDVPDTSMCLIQLRNGRESRLILIVAFDTSKELSRGFLKYPTLKYLANVSFFIGGIVAELNFATSVDFPFFSSTLNLKIC